MLRHIISIIQHSMYSNVQVLKLSVQLKICNNGMAGYQCHKSSNKHCGTYSKTFQFLWCLFQNSMKTELK